MPTGPIDSSAGQRPPSALHWAVLAAVLVIQAVLQSYFFPVGELLSDRPLFHIDSAFHQYQMELARQLCEQGRLVGYDPYFAAGYLGGVTYNASAKVPALMSCLAGTANGVVPLYKLYTFLMGVLGPVAVVLAAWMLRLGPRAAGLAGLFAMLLWWTGPVRWYHTAGLVSFVAAAFWSLPFVAAFARTCEAPRPLAVMGVALAGALGMLLHPLFPVVAALVGAPLLLCTRNDFGGLRRILAMAAIVAVTMLVLNGPWLMATLGNTNIAGSQPYQRLVDPWLFAKEPLGIAPTAAGGSRLYVALVVGSMAAALLASLAMRRLMLGCIAAWLTLMVWASLGGLHPGIAALQPNRFSLVAWLVLVIPAAWGSVAAWRAWRHRTPQQKPRGQWLLPAAATVIVGIVSAYFVREAALEIFSSRAARYAVARPEVKGEGPVLKQLSAWIRTNTDGSARVFFENSLARVHDGAHIAGALVMQTRREFIGGPYPFTDFASAWDAEAFGHSIGKLDPNALVRYLDLYNVKWMLCHSPACRAAMATVPDASQVAQIGPVTAFERRVSPSYFAVGSASIRASCVNRIEVEPAVGSAELVLKYHWAPGLVSSPPLPLGKRLLLDDPRPFIVVERPGGPFVLGIGRPAAACPEPGGASPVALTR